jgi:ribosomal protein L16/L10AE
MGKGKGKLAGWVSQARAGTTVVEYRLLRQGRATYYGTQIRYRLPVQSTLVWRDRDRDYINSYTSSRMKGVERPMRSFKDGGDEI